MNIFQWTRTHYWYSYSNFGSLNTEWRENWELSIIYYRTWNKNGTKYAILYGISSLSVLSLHVCDNVKHMQMVITADCNNIITYMFYWSINSWIYLDMAYTEQMGIQFIRIVWNTNVCFWCFRTFWRCSPMNNIIPSWGRNTALEIFPPPPPTKQYSRINMKHEMLMIHESRLRQEYN